MKAEELKHSVIFSILRKNEKVQKAALRLGVRGDWAVLKEFVAQVKQALLEATLEADDLEEIKKYKFLIRGMESIVLLPRLVDFVKEMEKKDELRKEEQKKEAERKKFAPGSFIRKAVGRIRGR